jgi:hypothetical protein
VKATVRKKTYNLDSTLIEKARRLFRVKTETEAIQKALQKAIDDQEVQDSLEALLKEGHFRAIYK